MPKTTTAPRPRDKRKSRSGKDDATEWFDFKNLNAPPGEHHTHQPERTRHLNSLPPMTATAKPEPNTNVTEKLAEQAAAAPVEGFDKATKERLAALEEDAEDRAESGGGYHRKR